MRVLNVGRWLFTGFAWIALALFVDAVNAQQSSVTGTSRAAVGRALYPINSAETAAGVTASNSTLYYPYCDSRRYRFNGNGTADNTAAFNRAVSSCVNEELKIYSGTYNFTSKPNDLPANTSIIGVGRLPVTLRSSYNEATATQGFLNITNGADGINIKHLRIVKQTGFSGGAGIAAASTAADPAGFITIDGVNVTTDNGTWNYAIFLDGRLLTTLGVRDVTIRDSYFFASTTAVGAFYGLVNANIDAGFYPAGGTSNVLLIDGDADTITTNSTFNIRFTENITFGYTSDVYVAVSTNVAIVDTANTLRTIVFAPRISSDTANRLATNFASNSLWANGYKLSRHAAARVTGATGAITANKNFTSCTRSATGTYTCDITAAGFSAAPFCTCQSSGGINTGVSCGGAPTSTNTGNISTFTGAAAADHNFTIVCVEN